MWTTETVNLIGPDRSRAGRFVQSGKTSFFPVPVLRNSTTGKAVMFFQAAGVERTSPPGGSPARVTSRRAPRGRAIAVRHNTGRRDID